MTKKVVLLIFVPVIAVAAWFGVAAYRHAHDTPGRAAMTFMQNLADRDAAKTYEQLSGGLQAQYKGNAWQDFVKSLGSPDTKITPIVVTNTRINDRFNAYPKNDAHRFVYDLQVKGRQYRVTTVILKQDNSWKIDDFQGSYK